MDLIAKEALTIILVFETYLDGSLKEETRVKRKAGKVPRQYDINETTLLSKITLTDLLAYHKTKVSLTKYLSRASNKCIVAGNGEISMDGNRVIRIITKKLILCQIFSFPSFNFLRKLFQSMLLIRMFSHFYFNTKCLRLYMKINTNEYIDMTSFAELFDNNVYSALMSWRCLTGSDTNGIFCGKTKEFWVKLYLENIKDTVMSFL